MTISRPRPRAVLRCGLLACMILASGLASRAAHAAPADPQVPFDEGRALVRAGRFAEAVQKFEDSLALRPSAGALLNLADCYERLARYASAVAAFERAQHLAEQAGDAARTEEAKGRAAALRPGVSTITVRLTPVEGMSVAIDRSPVKVGEPVAVDGGEHTVVVSARCYQTFQTRISVAARGDTRGLTSELVRDEAACRGPVPEAPAEAPVMPHQAPEAPPPSSWWTTPHTLAVGAVGASAAALTVAVVFGVLAGSNKSHLASRCRSYPNGCPLGERADLDETADRADSQATVSTVGFIASGVLLAGAGVALLVAPRSTTAARLLVSPAWIAF